MPPRWFLPLFVHIIFAREPFEAATKKKDIKQEEGQRDMFHVLLSTTLLNQNETNL